MVVRTGKRTRVGLLMDGWNSMIRYYKNNFSDGFRQVQSVEHTTTRRGHSSIDMTS